MRCVFVGVEYAGKSTLIDLLSTYYRHRAQPVHGDDHFTIPDSTLSPESRELMIGFPNDVKERMQRMQIQYHVEVIRNYANTLISGWHIEEAIYSEFYGEDEDSPYYPRYGYRQQRLYESQVLEARLPDIVFIHVKATEEAIRERMKANPHDYQIIKEADVGRLLDRFTDEVERSLFTDKGRLIELDTTEKTPEESLDELLTASERLITAGEVAMRAIDVPAPEYEVQYEKGLRRMLPKAGG